MKTYLERHCWFWHDWGGWIGSDSQPTLKRTCMSCPATEVVPDTKRIKWLEENSLPLDQFLKALDCTICDGRGWYDPAFIGVEFDCHKCKGTGKCSL